MKSGTRKIEFLNRELSWLEFDQRVLDEAEDPAVPLLERLKFLSITASNLDEFFMVRVGGLHLFINEGIQTPDPTGLTPLQQMDAVRLRARSIVKSQYDAFTLRIEPELSKAGIRRKNRRNLTDTQLSSLQKLFRSEFYSILTPIAVEDPETFPLLHNLGINLLVRIQAAPSTRRHRYFVIPLGPNLNRFIQIPSDTGYQYILVEDFVQLFIQDLCPGEHIMETTVFRITRNADMRVREDGAVSLLEGMETILLERKLSQCVRLEISAKASKTSVNFIHNILDITTEQIYRIPGPISLCDFMQLSCIDGFDEHCYESWTPVFPPDIDKKTTMMAQIAKRDILLCHPYDSYDPVVHFIEEAADDSDVVAIKQILYRTSKDSPIIDALTRAAKQGKYVTVIVELKARFDEARNIEWARALEHAGVHVVYGVKNLKTHAKICMVVRRESHGIVRYMHFGTGNYNERTARIYSDISYFTCREELGNDAAAFLNAITGFSQPIEFNKLSMAPIGIRDRIIELIDNETERRKQGQKASIMVKMNSLVDCDIIRALYRASAAGVKIRINVRGICCLRPNVSGLSKNIQVVSIIDRLLEHARIFYFYHGGDELTFMSSADWMPRNLDKRIELLVPIEDAECRKKLLSIMDCYFKDNVKSRKLLADGRFIPPLNIKGKPFQAQRELYLRAETAAQQALKIKPIEFEPYSADEHS